MARARKTRKAGATPEALAAKFVELLREELTQTDWVEMMIRNAEHRRHGNVNVCASHDFCDANMTMDAAWRTVVGTELDAASEADAALWNAAWKIADREHLCAKEPSRFATLQARALDTGEGRAFVAAGFELREMGGGCTAWAKVHKDGRFTLITDADGCSHLLADGADEVWLVGEYPSEDSFINSPERTEVKELPRLAIIKYLKEVTL